MLPSRAPTDAVAAVRASAEAGWRSDMAPSPAFFARFPRRTPPETWTRPFDWPRAPPPIGNDIFTEDALAWCYFKTGRLRDAEAAIARGATKPARRETIHPRPRRRPSPRPLGERTIGERTGLDVGVRVTSRERARPADFDVKGSGSARGLVAKFPGWRRRARHQHMPKGLRRATGR